MAMIVTGSLSFKGVGVRQDSINNDPVYANRSELPFGIKTPVELSNGSDELFVMHRSLRSQVRDNLKNLLLTNHGERVCNYFFGADLRPLCSEFSNKEDFDNEAMININTAIKKFMPYIVPLEFNSNMDRTDKPKGMSKLIITIVYSIPKLRVQRDQIDITMILM